MKDAVAERLWGAGLLAAALVPQSEDARGAIRVPEVRVGEIKSPVDHTDDDAAAGRGFVMRTPLIGVQYGVRRKFRQPHAFQLEIGPEQGVARGHPVDC